ncbi:MAG TPA: hypothetical protein DCZ95_05385 [Verrucomicrobia bacterium]|nr:MAG: hypothetical protein A2X46_10320 [Lentisphaerae bacterium GWF2_57_35]HBA83511.1 hypothetical protein [Verrucomicrobiota bacterium]
MKNKNMEMIKTEGMLKFLKSEEKKWKCRQCGKLLCVHREICLHCGHANKLFPATKKVKN